MVILTVESFIELSRSEQSPASLVYLIAISLPKSAIPARKHRRITSLMNRVVGTMTRELFVPSLINNPHRGDASGDLEAARDFAHAAITARYPPAIHYGMPRLARSRPHNTQAVDPSVQRERDTLRSRSAMPSS